MRFSSDAYVIRIVPQKCDFPRLVPRSRYEAIGSKGEISGGSRVVGVIHRVGKKEG